MSKKERAAADPIRLSRPDETVCPDCGGAVPGGVAGCRKRFEELQVRNQRLGDLNLLRMCVDAYCLQHPEPYMHSTKSETAHLVSMCWLLEYSASPTVWKKLQSRLGDRQHEARLPVPTEKGGITLADVLPVAEQAAYRAAVRDWAHSAWQAWAQHHPTVRQWVEAAISKGG